MDDDATQQLTSDLRALSAAAAPGHADEVVQGALTEAENRRLERIAELRAQYQAGTLSVDSASLARKLVDDHLRD